MTIEKAVDTLNKHRYGQTDNWQVEDDCILGGPNLERDIFIHDAVFIAQALELREAVEPFIEIAKHIPPGDDPVEIAYSGPDSSLFYGDVMNADDWHKLAEFAKE